MNSKEIAALASWTAETIKDGLAQDGRKIDKVGADIIREVVQTLLTDWQSGKKITKDTLAEIAEDIFSRRRHETKTLDETFNAVMILLSEFPIFAANQAYERDAEAARLAKIMPAVKV